MSAIREPKCCQHCLGYPACEFVSPGGLAPVFTEAFWRHTDANGAQWPDGCCPGCAVAKKITDDLAAPDEFPGISSRDTVDLLIEVYGGCQEIALDHVGRV